MLQSLVFHLLAKPGDTFEALFVSTPPPGLPFTQQELVADISQLWTRLGVAAPWLATAPQSAVPLQQLISYAGQEWELQAYPESPPDGFIHWRGYLQTTKGDGLGKVQADLSAAQHRIATHEAVYAQQAEALAAATLGLENAQQFLQDVISSTPDALLVLNKDYKVLYVNQVSRDIYQQAGIPIVSGTTSAYALLPQEEHAQFAVHWEKAFQGERVFGENESHSFGKRQVFQGSYNPIWDRDGKVVAISIFFRDITQQKEDEHQLREQAQQLQLQKEELATQNEELTSQQEELTTQMDQLTAMQEELMQVRADFVKITESVPSALFRFVLHPDGSGKITYMSKRAQELYGYPADAFVENYGLILDLMDPAEHERYFAVVQESARTLEQFTWEGQFVLAGGQRKWVRVISRPERLKDSSVVWYGIATDFSERRAQDLELKSKTEELAAQQEEMRLNLETLVTTEAELRLSQARLNVFLDNIPTGVAVLDKDQKAVLLNNYARNLLSSLPPEPGAAQDDDSMSVNVSALLAPAAQVLGPAYKRRKGYSDNIALPGPIRLEITVSPVYLEDSPHEYVVVVFQDITRRKQDEEALHATQQKLQAILDSYPHIILAVDGKGKCTLAKGAGWHSLGLQQEDLVGHSLQGVAAFSAELIEDINQALEGKALQATRTIAGRCFELTYLPLKDPLDQLDGAMVIAIDVTERQQITEDLVEARRVAEEAAHAKERFVANMSHEIRTPLNGIIGLTDLLAQTITTSEQRNYLNMLQLSADNLLIIINDVLDFSKIQAGKVELEVIEFSLPHVLEGLRNSFLPKLQSQKVSYQLQVDEGLPAVLLGDPYRLNQVLLNLLSNAFKFTTEGEVTLAVKMLVCTPNHCDVVFLVSDTGIGIPEERLPSIFDAFTSATQHTANLYGGTGLGLSIVKQLVEAQQGTVAVTSKAGQGTTFTIQLRFEVPRHPTGLPAKPLLSSSAELRTSHTQARILLVEDHPINQLVATEVLGKMGFHYRVADNGRKAIEWLEKEHFDLILMDIRMPEMDGYQTTEYIRTYLPSPLREIPIIAMTAHAFVEEREKCFQVGMNDYLSKPFKPEQLMAKIDQLLTYSGTKPREIAASYDPIPPKGLNYSTTVLEELFRGRKDSINNFILLAGEQLEAAAKLLESADEQGTDVADCLHKLKTTFRFLGLEVEAARMEAVEASYSKPGKVVAAQQELLVFSQQCTNLFAQLKQDFPDLALKGNVAD